MNTGTTGQDPRGGYPPPVGSEKRCILFFDGDCGLCSRSVRFLMRQDRRKILYFAPIGGATAAECLEAELRESLSTVVYQRPTKGGKTETLLRSEAVLSALIDSGSHWRWLAHPARWIPATWRDVLYNWVARNRHRFFPQESCALGSDAERTRLLP